MKPFCSAVMLAVLLNASAGLAQQRPDSPGPPPPRVNRPVVTPAPADVPVPPGRRQVIRSSRDPPSTGITAPPRPANGPRLVYPPTEELPPAQDGPRLIRVPDVASLPAMARRPIVRRVAMRGGWLAVPAVVIVGAPFVLDVPELGWVYVPEDEYQAVYDLLSSDDPNDVEQAYVRLKELQQAADARR